MKRQRLIKAVVVPVAVALGASLIGDADNPHTEPRQYEEEPQMTYETPYTTTSVAVLSSPIFDSSLESVFVPPICEKESEQP